MPRKLSAGLLLYRRGEHDDQIVVEVLLAHMGGPFWAHKDDGAWSFPEIDRARWFAADVARVKLVRGQAALIDRLLQTFANPT